MRALFLPPAGHTARSRAVPRATRFAGRARILHRARPARTRFAAIVLLASALHLLAARSVSAQYPGELAGRVSDGISGEPVEGVQVEVVGTDLLALTDGRGEFRIRGLEPGQRTVRLTRLGYAPLVREVEIRNGERSWLAVRLAARPVAIAALRARAGGAPPPGAIRITRAEIERLGARTAAEALDGHAGLILRRRGPTGPQSLTIRGSASDEVLVLLDGIPLGSALTGEADLSAIPAAQIESITVLKGSQSARYGPGAQAGVVLIETRATAPPLGLRLETGSLGAWSGAAEASGRAGRLRWSAGGHARRLGGRFEFERPAALGGGPQDRLNADLSELGGFGAAAAALAGGELRLRAGLTRLDRGTPGPSFLPALEAREELSRWRASAAWERVQGRARVTAELHDVTQTARFLDPAPPAGVPFDGRTRALSLGGRLRTEISVGGALESVSAGLEVRRQDYRSTELDASAPGGRLDLGLFAGGELAPGRSANGPRLVAALRIDRDDLAHLWRATHELTGSAGFGPARFHVRHASSYSPPTFGDQFFKEGVAVEPNPGLRAERVPNDWSLGAAVGGRIGRAVVARLALDGYIADVKDMIIWAPDFRFVWSPRNFDVKRRGLEVESEIEVPAHRLELRASYALARATYDRPGDDDVQVIYRPRHSGALAAAWTPARWELGADIRFVGTRYPVPAPVNALDPYWTVALRLRRSFDAGAWQLTPTLVVDRLLDNEDSLIFGYPEPGRTFRLELALRPRRAP